MNKEEYWFWLCSIKGLFQPDIKKMLDEFGTPEEIWQAKEGEIRKRVKLSQRQYEALEQSRDKDTFMSELERLKRNNINFIYIESPSFPNALRFLEDCPYCLYVKGNLPDPEVPSVGMVGARACSVYGKEQAENIAGRLALAGIQIISGMALGIDSYSAKAAINAGGKTFAILGGGVDVIYPRENIELYYEIITSGGGIISEYPMGAAPLGWQFPHRNRLICAFSDWLAVIEAAKRSGTLTTASHALDQGMDIYALPGRITDPVSCGCNRLIADGAGIILSAESFAEELSGTCRWKKWKEQYQKSAGPEQINQKIEKIAGELSENAKLIHKNLGSDCVSTDELSLNLKLSASAVCEAVSELELEGFITRINSNLVVRK